MSTSAHLDMHHGRGGWRNDLAAWREELRQWQTELNETTTEISRINRQLTFCLDTLQRHGVSVSAYEQDLYEHEHEMSLFERGENANVMEVAKQHILAKEKHQERAEVHTKLRQQHHSVMSRWRSMLRALPITPSDRLHAAVAPARQVNVQPNELCE